jgi:hypothetical protein
MRAPSSWSYESPFLEEVLADPGATADPMSSEWDEVRWPEEVGALAESLSSGARAHLEQALSGGWAAGQLSLEHADSESWEGESYDFESLDSRDFEAEASRGRVAPGARAPAVAVPAFAAAERARVVQPLLDAKRAAVAATRNGQMQRKSGVTADALRVALRDYVDEAAVARALAATGRTTPSRASAVGGGSFDAVLVEAIHTFQKKCYLSPKEADGIAGASTLESLGFIHHTLPRSDATFAGAQRALLASAAKVEAAVGGRYKVARWFAEFVNPAFLGHKFKLGVHPILIESLRKAERHLLSQRAYAGLTPVALGRALGFSESREPHGGGRRNPNLSGSFHGPGLAIDVRYLANPWVAGNPAAPNGNAAFTNVMARATLLLSGQAERVDAAYLSRLGSHPTAAICARLSGLSDTLVRYLALGPDVAGLRAALDSRRTVAGLRQEGETLEQAVGRVRARIRSDTEALRGKGNFGGRDGRKGFFDLPTDLVVALRDHAGLRWGAVDLGATQSGDVMHFDLACAPIGSVLRPGACGTATPRTTPAPPKVPASKAPVVQPAIEPPGRTLYAEIPVQSPKTRSRVGIYVPARLRPRADIDLVVYLHGLLSPCSSPGPGIDRYWDRRLTQPKQAYGTGPMALREALYDSRRSAILVAPSLGAGSHAGALTARGGFDAFVDGVLAELRARGGLAVPPQSVRHIVLAGHSKGGAHMRGIVAAGDAMTARIREIQGFDCFYSDADPAFWTKWAGGDTTRRFVHCYIAGYDKAKRKLGPWRRTEVLRGLAAKAGLGNVELVDARKEAGARENHCSVPMTFLRRRLEASAALAGV